jgi:hypothetical protein
VALSLSILARYGRDRRVRWILQSHIVSKKSDSPTRLPPNHHGPVRSMIAEASGTDYIALETFEAARNRPESIVILEGDCGGPALASSKN